MDQKQQELQELKILRQHLQKAATLEKKIEDNYERIHKGVSDDYVFCEKKTSDEEQKRKEKCRSENLAKVAGKVRAWKISRICLVVLFFVAVAVITAIDSTFLTASRHGEYSVIGGFTCIGYWIATVIIIRNIDDTGYNFSAKQKAWIAEGARIDLAVQERNKEAFENARKKSYKEQRKVIAELQAEQSEYKKELAQLRQAIAASDVVGNNEKNFKAINFLINQIEGKRANSVQEALLQYDTKTAKEEEERARLAHYQFMYDMQRQADGQRAMQEADAYMRQTFHNMEMQKQARRQTEELERIRRELETSN